ncbi:sigma 54-interacting transcriptional regulator [Acanthopleuribacter pedis]|uniref:Sigma 54-interacting transcriptional regulator n=1 Tax=Acanthopleuribacter pedis TaxID=442870 RepID=A0A8J7QDJ8_9BACT|nr:sigma 54-interacting transcriptional regulator [Acanthopleuribacter pedis]MBO1317108.1 sigma 54-interacting transcriptional regulator [Acanthopleuribacter pedis]
MNLDHLHAATEPSQTLTEEETRRFPTFTIVSHPIPSRIGDVYQLQSKDMALSRIAPDFMNPDSYLLSPLADPFLSRAPIQFDFGTGRQLVIHPNGKGQAVLNGETLTEPRAVFLKELERGVHLVLANRIVLWLHHGPLLTRQVVHHGLVGHSEAVRKLRKEISLVADLSCPVLLRGGSGTGKELVATAIHEAGNRRGPFVSVNMGAIPASLAASELFGAVKGAYTGSQQNQLGYFRSAQDGTLFLDEIGETSPEIQVMLLRALETREIAPVGAQKNIAFDTRFLAATDANLESKMEVDAFKAPLFHRLAGYEIKLPPLAKRLEDLGRLFLHFAQPILEELQELARITPKDPYITPWIPTKLMVQLLECPWPGNVRQLRNSVQQLLVANRGRPYLTATATLTESLSDPTAVVKQAEEQTPKPVLEAPKKRTKPSQLSHDEVREALRTARWDIQAGADRLGISRGALYLLMKKIPGLHKASELEADIILVALRECGGDLQIAADQLCVSASALRRRCKRIWPDGTPPV